MRGISWLSAVKIVGIIAVLLLPQVFAAVADADPTDKICRKDSPDPDPAHRINSAPCGTYAPCGAGPLTDGFTYVVSDGKGGITASYVIVTLP